MPELKSECDFFCSIKSSFASASQPKDTDEGQIEEYLYKFICSFIDDDGNIVFNNHISLDKFSHLKDGSLSDKKHFIPQIEQWFKMNTQYLADKENYIEKLHDLRKRFFDILDAIAPHCNKNDSVVKMINKFLNDVATDWKAVDVNRKNPLNIKDQKLSKTENTLFALKSIACLHKMHSESKGLTYEDLSKDYFDTYRIVLKENLENDADALMQTGSSSESRHPFLVKYNMY